MTVALLTALAVALLVARLVRRWGRRWLLDQPNARSSHVRPTPRGGGIGIVAGVAVGALAAGERALLPVVVLVLLMALLSFLDDLRSLSTRVRLLVQVAIAGCAIAWIGPFHAIHLPGIGTYEGHLLLQALSLVWLVGLANAYNFMDGIDGIAAWQGIVSGAAWWWFGHEMGNGAVALGGALAMAGCLGFLPLNWPRATLFMGDVGSASLGLLFGLLPLLAANAGAEAAPIPGIAALILWPFLFDTLWTMGQRARRGERLFEAHRSHLYQRLAIAGWPHWRVTLLYTILAAVSVAGAAAMRGTSAAAPWGVAIGVAAVLLAVTRAVERARGR